MNFHPHVVLLVLVLTTTAVADCTIDGNWDDNDYYAGDTMEFQGEISPSSGFIRGYIENSLGDEIAQIPLTQIDTDYSIEIDVNDSYINGTYTAHFTYVNYANGTSCGQSISDTTDLHTTNSLSTVEINIELSQSYSSTPFEYTGTPVETSLGTITSVVRGTGPQGIASSLKLLGTQLVQGQGIGNIDIALTQCQQNEQTMDAYYKISNFLNSSFTDIVSYETAIERMKGEISDNLFRIDNLTGEKEKVSNELKEAYKTMGSKWDWWLVIIIGIPLGMFALILVQQNYLRYQKQRLTSPLPLTIKKDDNANVRK